MAKQAKRPNPKPRHKDRLTVKRHTSKPLKPGKYTDGGGLSLLVSDIGSKSWSFRFERKGIDRAMVLGPLHGNGGAREKGDEGRGFTLDEARNEAKKALDLLKLGIDPIDARRQLKNGNVRRSAEQVAEAAKETGLMAQVRQRDDESYAKSFSQKFENDLDFRKQWRDLTEVKHSMALAKGMATLTPTSTEVGNTNFSDDSAEAVRLLSEMAEKQGRKFEEVFADPAKAKLAAQTYTAHHRSSTSGGELQGSGRDRLP